ncbi:MAG: arginine--tRNA ligase, partial [Patescibacteria group bacterium]
MTKDEIIKALQKASGSKQIQLDSPENEEFGDYATNTALTQAQKEKKKPRELAEKIVIKLKKDETLAKITLKIEVAGPGFINFWLAKEMLALELQNVVKNGDKYGSSNVGKGKKVIVEYSSPNIAKAFGIGHLRSTIIGQAIYNLYEVLGYKVIGDNHIGDWGTQFGMIIAQVERKNLEASKLSVGDFEKLYIEFNERLQKEPKLREVAKDAFKRLESGDKTAREIWREAKRTSQDEFERIYKRLGVEIDNAYGESFYENKMGDVIDELRKKRLSKKSEGAEIVEFTHST